MRASKVVHTDRVIQQIQVRLTKRDLVKVFLVVVGAEMAAHMPLSVIKTKQIDKAATLVDEKLEAMRNASV